jgi:hypothetical protein
VQAADESFGKWLTAPDRTEQCIWAFLRRARHLGGAMRRASHFLGVDRRASGWSEDTPQDVAVLAAKRRCIKDRHGRSPSSSRFANRWPDHDINVTVSQQFPGNVNLL